VVGEKMRIKRILKRFLKYADEHWREINEEMGFFGKLTPVTEMRVRPHNELVFVYSLLTKVGMGGLDRSLMLRKVVKGLRYAYRSHISFNDKDLREHLWGDDWQSTLWTTYLALALYVLEGQVPEDVIDGIRRVVAYEADRFIDLEPPSGLIGDTKAEENAWDATLLAFASNMMPEHPHADKWEEAAKRFAMNSFSQFDDHFNNQWMDGRPVREWVSTITIFPDFTVENHGSFHPGYLGAYGLLFLASMAYWLKGKRPPPQFMYKFEKWYETYRRFILWNGRIAYPCGHDWPNVRVGSPFMMAYIAKFHQESMAGYLYRVYIKRLEELQRMSKDGSFYGAFLQEDYPGFASGRRLEFEADVAANLALCYMLDVNVKEGSDEGSLEELETGIYHHKYSEFIMARTPYVFASFSWKSLRHRPMGLVIPKPREDFGGWKEGSLTGYTAFEGGEDKVKVIFHNDYVNESSFMTLGLTKNGFHEGKWLSDQYILFALLPDMRTCVLYEHVKALNDIHVTTNIGLRYFYENDLMNRNKRIIYYGNERLEVEGVGGQTRELKVNSNYVNIEDSLTIYSEGKALVYLDSAERNDNYWKSVNMDSIYIPFRKGDFKEGDIVRDYVVIFVAKQKHDEVDNPLIIRNFENELLVLKIRGQDGRSYLLAANLKPENERLIVRRGEEEYVLNAYEVLLDEI